MTAPSRVAIVGGTSLLGDEIRDLLNEAGVPTRLVGVDKDEIGTMTEEAGEAVVITALDQENLAGARVVFLAGSAESSRRALEVMDGFENPPAIIDLTYVLEERMSASLRAPVVEPPQYVPPNSAENYVAHPASVALALFLTRLDQVQGIRRSIVHVFEPASERGRRGRDELANQTVSLLNLKLKKLPKAVYDEQVSFNLLARYGEGAPESMESVEARVERHLASLLALHGPIPMPSVRAIQAPVFHGHSFSVWVEFDDEPGAEHLETALATHQIDVRGRDLDPPNIVGMAGQSGIAVGAIASDHNHPHASWFWMVSDNLRMTADNAVAVARPMLGHGARARPS
jgi:aspartate-semialdehyde dehydrogenase